MEAINPRRGTVAVVLPLLATVPMRKNDDGTGLRRFKPVLQKTKTMQAGRGPTALVVMSGTPSIQRHSLSMSPKAYVAFSGFVLRPCVFSPLLFAWSHGQTTWNLLGSGRVK